MILALCGVVALALPGLRPRLSLRGNPRWFAVLDAAALLTGLAAITAGSIVTAVVGLAELVGSARVDTSGWHLVPRGAFGAILGTSLLGWIIVRTTKQIRHTAQGSRAARADLWLGDHNFAADHDLVVLPLDGHVAYAVEGSPPQVVISRGLRDCGDDDFVAFVVDHERAHIGQRHQRLLLIARVVDVTFGWVPSMRRSALALEFALERAADEEAAGHDAMRRRHLGHVLQRNPPSWSGSCSPEALAYRGELLSTPAPPIDRRAIAAALGLTPLVGTILAMTAHVSIEVPTLITSIVR